MPDDAPAASDRAPQRTIEDAIAEAEHLLQETFDRLDPDHANGGWFITRITKIREALADRPKGGCRAAGAATPPSDSVSILKTHLDELVTRSNRLYDIERRAAAGAGAATPALTAENSQDLRKAAEQVVDAWNDSPHKTLSVAEAIVVLRHALAVAAPSLAATPLGAGAENRERILGETLLKVLIHIGMLRPDAEPSGVELVAAAKTFCDDAPGPQRKEPTP